MDGVPDIGVLSGPEGFYIGAMSDPFDLTDLPPEHSGPDAQPAPPRYLTGLNDSQAEAVAAMDGPVLLLAGAGTGKTRTLTTRLAHILNTGRARPWQMLAVTFTNKAAHEMQERVADLIGHPVEGWWVGTFHALGARMLRRHAELVGLRPNFTILDADDQQRLLKQVMEPLGIDEKRWPPRTVLGLIQRWKDRGLAPDKVSDVEGADAADGKAAEVYAAYQDRLTTLNAADFGDLLMLCVKLFQTHPDILREYQQQFRYVLVDEYQDTNVVQYLWLRLLAQGHHNICCVGDDDQSIYSWRGAEVGNILRFESDFPGARVIRLERNYRSTPHILGAASGLIAFNEGRLGKTLWTDAEKGDKVRVRGVWDGDEEARVIGEEIEALHTKGHRLNEIAILVRAGFQTREFEERLMTLALPYRVIGGQKFYERKEIRDAIAYLRVMAQPDDDLAFERIINVPSRKIGPAVMQVLHGYARSQRVSLTRAVERLAETDELRPQARSALRALMENFAHWRSLLDGLGQAEVAQIVLDESGYTDMLRADKTPEAPGRLDNLKELVVALEDFESLDAFLEHVSLVMDNADKGDGDKVNIMTLHGAKGLEFESVFLPGWEEGLFPHQRALDEGGTAALEEERRLAYVGLTRARKRAFITHAANRRIYGRWQSAIPSRFVEELPDDHVSRDADPGLYAGGGRAFGAGGSPSFGRWRDVGAVASPGRMHPLTIDADDWKVSERDGDAAAFRVGERVFHQKFGYGTVRAVDGDKLDINFEKSSPKKVMASFVERG